MNNSPIKKGSWPITPDVWHEKCIKLCLLLNIKAQDGVINALYSMVSRKPERTALLSLLWLSRTEKAHLTSQWLYKAIADVELNQRDDRSSREKETERAEALAFGQVAMPSYFQQVMKMLEYAGEDPSVKQFVGDRAIASAYADCPTWERPRMLAGVQGDRLERLVAAGKISELDLGYDPSRERWKLAEGGLSENEVREGWHMESDKWAMQYIRI